MRGTKARAPGTLSLELKHLICRERHQDLRVHHMPLLSKRRREGHGLVTYLSRTRNPIRAARNRARAEMPRFVRDKGNISDLFELAYRGVDYRVISFDLFDTLVHRRCSLQTIIDRTAEFGSRTIHGDYGPIPSSVFVAARGVISERVKQRDTQSFGRNEIVLEELFERAMRPFISAPQRRAHASQKLVQYEVCNEIAGLEVDPEFIELVSSIATRGQKAILITDMYFRKQSIIQILEELGIAKFLDEVYVSAELGVTKHSGKIFDVVADDLGVTPQHILHVGDNYVSDVERPREHGWHALHYFNPDRELARRAHVHNSNLLAKDPMLRSNWIEKSFASSDAPDDLQHLVDTVIAPAFLIYTLRCLEFAEQRELDRLYFLTRDGIIFKKIAEIIQRRAHIYKGGSLTSLRKLELNRSSAFLLTYQGFEDWQWSEHAVNYLAQQPFSTAGLLRAFNMDYSELPGLRPNDHDRLSKVLAAEDVSSLAELFNVNLDIRDSFDSLFRERKQCVVDYLLQNGALGHDRIGLVDIGYSGTAAKFISNYLMNETHLEDYASTEVHSLFFATNRFFPANIPQMHPGVVLHDGLMLSHRCVEDRTAVMNFGWLEPFAVDPCLGSLLRHRRTQDGVVADFAEPGSAESRTHLQDMVLRRAEALFDQMILCSSASLDECHRVATASLRRFVKSPSRRQVRAVEQLAHDFGLVADEQRSIVSRMTFRDVATSLHRLRSGDIWIQGSLRKSNLQWLAPLVESWASRRYS